MTTFVFGEASAIAQVTVPVRDKKGREVVRPERVEAEATIKDAEEVVVRAGREATSDGYWQLDPRIRFSDPRWPGADSLVAGALQAQCVSRSIFG